jgi:hypothetical protein
MQPTVQPWELFADVLLQREAAVCRIVSGVPPRDFAGLYVGQDDIDALLASLPGLDGPAPERAAPVAKAFEALLAEAAGELAAWVRTAPEPFAACVRNARLTPPEAEVFAVLAAVDLHPARQRLVAYIQDSVQLPRPTLATLARVFGPGHVGARALAPGAGLRRAQLVTIEDGAPWAVRMCGLTARVSWALSGAGPLDPGLPPGARVIPGEHPAAPAGGEPAPVRLVHGGDPDSRVLAARAALGNRACLVLRSPASAAEWNAAIREATVSGLAVLVELAGPPPPEAAHVVDGSAHLAWAWCSPAELPLDCLPRRPWRELPVPDPAATEAEWRAVFDAAPPPGVRLTREQLRHVGAATGGDIAALPEGVRRLAGGHLDSVAVRLRPQRRWDDLVLPDDQRAQLREVIARHRGRATVFGEWGFPVLPSTGVVALFAGPPGTGKTLAAEVLAAELGLDLYKVELSSVVSKWIGETEKNLGRIFDAAQARELVLFFDEADALYGKRSEVSDAHDRYANIEVAYLLQRLETYDGLVILATNLQANIDPAFLRRISVSVEFAVPEEAQRREIWRRAFPGRAPTEDLDIDFLARQFTVPGGVIRNAALSAAFMAAEAGGPITMRLVALALGREYQKLGKLRTEAEFAHLYPAIARGPVPPT